MDHVRTAAHLDDLGFLPAVEQNAHRVADLESTEPGPVLIRGWIRNGSRRAARPGLGLRRSLKVARRKEGHHLPIGRIAPLKWPAGIVGLHVALVVGVGARAR